jgi:hypothetical protein
MPQAFSRKFVSLAIALIVLSIEALAICPVKEASFGGTAIGALAVKINDGAASGDRPGAFETFLYMLPTDPRITRPAACPERLSFRRSAKSFSQIREMLQAAKWREMYLCSGRPIEAGKLAGANLVSGAGDTHMAEFTYNSDQTGSRTSIGSIRVYFDHPTKDDLAAAATPKKPTQFEYEIKQDGADVLMKMTKGLHSIDRLIPEEVNGNGDFIFDDSELEAKFMDEFQRSLCEPGETFQIKEVAMHELIS